MSSVNSPPKIPWLFFAFSFLMFGFALLIAIPASKSVEVGQVAVPVSLAFTAIGGLACAVGMAFRGYGSRLQALEDKLADRDSVARAT